MQTIESICRAYIASYETGEQEKISAFLHPAHTYYPPGGGKPMTREERIADEHFFAAEVGFRSRRRRPDMST
jgi:hypothetical protein